ncbi:MAG: DUF632 domain-containing protein, partial [Sweet potato little leaf phytoplasma]|nr:DUF632 domain-containing protein [Sweet potato little leaf phytoplasma]
PDLEDEDYHSQHEVVKQVHGHQKLVVDPPASSSSNQQHHGNTNKKSDKVVVMEEEEDDAEDDNEEGKEEKGVEYEVHMVDKEVVQQHDHSSKDPAAFQPRPASRNPLDVAKQIELHFRRASDSGSEIAKLLEVGKLPYHRKHGAYQGYIHSCSLISSKLIDNH